MPNLYLKLGVPTVLICAIAGAGLAGTYAITKGPIAAQDKASQEKALRAVLPDAKSFERVADPAVLAAASKAAPDVEVGALFKASDASGQDVGWGVDVKSRGYGGPMEIAVGVDRNGKVSGVTMVTHNETPGLGTKVVGNKAYLAKFTGADSAEKAIKMDGITGATKSSRGVKRAVQAALLVYGAVFAQGGGTK